jgi:uncharacterized protein (TIGR02147 family)
MQPIFEYLDFRSFLKDWFVEAKSKKKGVSYRWFSARAGIASPVFPKLVMEGERNLGNSGIEGFADAMNLAGKERSFWIHLVGFNQAKTSQAKQEHYAILSDLVYSIQEESIGNSSFRYYAKWFHPVLRELATLRNFHDRWEILGTWVIPPIQPQEAQEGIETLLALGLLEHDPQGQLIQTKKAITSGNPLARKALLEFHKTMLDHSAKILEELPKESRHVSGMTLGVSGPCYDAILAEYEAFRSRVLRLVHRDQNSDRVMHMGFQLIPVACDPARGGSR